MKKIILALTVISSIASADLATGTYQGKTSTWLGSLTAKPCTLTITPISDGRVMSYKIEAGSIVETINMSANKLKSLASANGQQLSLNYDELGPDVRIQATIKLSLSADKKGLASLDWNSNRIVWQKSNIKKAACINLVKIN